MKVLKLGALALVLLVVLIVGAGYLWLNDEYTECYATYGSKKAAERSEPAWRDAGFDVSIERRSGWGAIVTDESSDSAGPQKRFLRVLKATNGRSGHGSYGCLVRSPIQ
jgi:hypothetical protein